MFVQAPRNRGFSSEVIEIKRKVSRAWRRQFYLSPRWRKKRKEIIERDNYECQHCKTKGKVGPAEAVHHIKHLQYYPELALVDDNLITLCGVCHNKEHPEKFERVNNKSHEARWA